MACKVFVDANIFLDFALKREDFLVSKRIFELAESEDIQTFTTPSVIHIVAYWLTKSYGANKTKELILSFLRDTKVIDTDHDVAINAISSRINDIEDALQYFAAMDHKLDYFLTRDKDFIKQALPALPIYLPADFLNEVIG